MVNDTRSIPKNFVLYSHTHLSLYTLLYFPNTAVDLLTKPDYIHTARYNDIGLNKLSQSLPLHGRHSNVCSFHCCTYGFCLSLKFTVLHNMLCLMLTSEVFHEDGFQRSQTVSRQSECLPIYMYQHVWKSELQSDGPHSHVFGHNSKSNWRFQTISNTKI